VRRECNRVKEYLSKISDRGTSSKKTRQQISAPFLNSKRVLFLPYGRDSDQPIAGQHNEEIQENTEKDVQEKRRKKQSTEKKQKSAKGKKGEKMKKRKTEEEGGRRRRRSGRT